MRDHTIVCGFGTKGRNAVATLIARGVAARPASSSSTPIADAVEEATRAGLRRGARPLDARPPCSRRPGSRTRRSVIVATDTDESSVLTTLTAREHNRDATIVAAVREAENRHLIHESGADSAIVSSGRRGAAARPRHRQPALVEVLEDLMTVGTGMDIVEREVGRRGRRHAARRHARRARRSSRSSRGGQTLRFDDPRRRRSRPATALVCLCSNGRHERAA